MTFYPIKAIYETITHFDININNNKDQLVYLNYKIPDDIYDIIYSKESNGNIRYKNITKVCCYTFRIYQKKDTINTEEMKYIHLLKNILQDGVNSESRNSSVISLFSPPSMRFDLRNGIPLLTSKRMPWKTILRELLWFISGCTDNKKLQDKGIHIWDGNSSKEFMESRGLKYKDGDLGPIYGFQWRHFGADYRGCDIDYNGEGFDQLKYIINEIKENPMSRRIILNAWNASDINKMALPPCHVMVQFNIEGKYIDAKLFQRSGDMFLGIPFNIASYSMLLYIIGNITDYTPRYFIHDIGNAHIYINHKEAIETQLQRKTYDQPKFIINKKLTDIDSIQESDFNIIDYNYYPPIKAEMVV